MEESLVKLLTLTSDPSSLVFLDFSIVTSLYIKGRSAHCDEFVGDSSSRTSSVVVVV